ncbi:hypothetical protein [Streptococcus marimammalium]|uniref:hypothetical protein n=1 Tax=Streptococcus marimammalium TaxID=269666 RepID=UPI000369D3C7|nr:hypothetical protein [Streptococcus marimammalium]
MVFGKTMLEVAKELGVSKEVVKYHRKKLEKTDYAQIRGQYFIFEEGIEKIKGQLRKDTSMYSNGFESNVLRRLTEIELSLMLMQTKLDELLKK